MIVKEYIKEGELFEAVYWDGTMSEAAQIVQNWIRAHTGYVDSANVFYKGELDYDLHTAAIVINHMEDLGFIQIVTPESYIVLSDEGTFLGYTKETFNTQFKETEAL